MENLVGKSQVQGIPIKKGEEGNTMRSDANANVFQHNNSLDHLGKQLRRSLDPNQPALTELQDQYYFSIGPEINFEVKPASKEAVIETKMNEHDLDADLKLKRSSPRSTSRVLSPSSSQGACLSSLVDFDEEDLGDILKVDLPGLVLVGCGFCYMYMMVSKDDLKCLICKNRELIDKFE